MQESLRDLLFSEAHLKKKKKCHKCSKARRANEKKERRKIQNKTYYIRRKWNIALALMSTSKVLDVFLSKIPESSEMESANLSESPRLLKQDAAEYSASRPSCRQQNIFFSYNITYFS
ncbi:hypothetical protein L915_11439 [Phytophthora nicotianae]|uniref:Uncharacterized protein n=1 Tax=Phytophthora nicotianae TaxID=4792 RepID=W2GK65_PHYNI|nr:hypothetical protein L915_11439 [Phytophthora nicotianae]ETL36725.1 hypothetical protein L916_11344 [Phytophthora nicotianae]